MSSSLNYMSHQEINKKMEQWQTKTHKIQKKRKLDDSKKIVNKLGLQFIDDCPNPNNQQQKSQNKNSAEQMVQILAGDSLYNLYSSEEEKKMQVENEKSYENHSQSVSKLNDSGETLCSNENNMLMCQNNHYSLNGDTLHFNQFEITPRFLYEPSEVRSFCIYNECVIDFDLMDDQNYIYQKSLTQPLTTFKKVKQIQKLNNGDFIEVQQESYTIPLIDYSFLIDQLKSFNNAEAYKWYQVLLIYQQKTQSQIDYMLNIKKSQEWQSQKIQELFAQRKQFASRLAQKYIKAIPRNQFCMYISYHYDYEALSLRQTCTGYSRKLLDLMGLSIQDAPSVFLRKGPLDLINKKIHTWNMLLAGIQLVGHPKQEIIDVAEGETFIQTLDNIQLQSKIQIKTYNLTYQFDRHHNIDFPISDDILVEIKYDIDEQNLSRFYQKRKENKILESFSVYDIIDGEFEYLMEVENFLQKYYEANVSTVSAKKKAEHKKLLEQKQKDGLYNQYPLCVEYSNQSNTESEQRNDIQKKIFGFSDQTCEIKKEDFCLEKNIIITKANLISHLDDQDPSFLISMTQL